MYFDLFQLRLGISEYNPNVSGGLSIFRCTTTEVNKYLGFLCPIDRYIGHLPL